MPITTGWLDEVDLKETLSILDDLSTRFASNGGEHGRKILGLIQAKDYAGLCNYKLPLAAYGWDIFQLMSCRQALSFYTKLKDLEIGVDKKAVAKAAFVAAEERCSETNEFFRGANAGKISLLPSLTLVLNRAKNKIARILGQVPDVSDLKLSFGPGATSSIKKRMANPQRKFAEPPTCSVELLRSPLFPSFLRSLPHWLDCHEERSYIDDEGYEVSVLNVVVGTGCIGFVPKSATTYRIIDKQPTLNTLLQGGIGRWMSDRLKRAGVDIRDQTLNQRLAREGSMTNSLATLDLSSASDTISRELVRYLLPYDWYRFLADAGCNTTFFGGVYNLQKFCSMGNGYTFPLETLIFWALTTSVCVNEASKVSVYGDDIICPSTKAASVIRVLEACGFVINTTKSYLSGPFRESCGADYYLGISCRPYYQKHLVSGETLFTLHNYLYRHCDDMYKYVRDLIPEPLRIYGPDGFGDGHLLSSKWESFRTRQARRRGYGGWYFSSYSRLGRGLVSSYPCDYVTPLYSIYTRSYGTVLDPCDTHVKFSADGRPIWPVPGCEGYEKKLIYTFALS